MPRTHSAGKGPGGCLDSRNRRGSGMPPTPGLREWGTSSGNPAGFLGPSGQGKYPPLLSCSSGPGGPLPPASTDLPSLPLMPPGPMWWGERGALGGQGTGLGVQQAPWALAGRENAL